MARLFPTLRPPTLRLAILVTVVATTACSSVMAIRQPGKKDLDVLQENVPRAVVVAELGEPKRSTRDLQGHLVDYFGFSQGYSKTNKYGRAIAHLVADAATMGAWEVVGVPVEYVVDGTEMTAVVVYRADGRVAGASLFEKGELTMAFGLAPVGTTSSTPGDAPASPLMAAAPPPMSSVKTMPASSPPATPPVRPPTVMYAALSEPVLDRRPEAIALAESPPPRRVRGAFGEYHALVIGNDAYRHFPTLNTARHDAQVIAELLSEDYGYDVRLLENANRADIVSALYSYRRSLDENDNLLVYYAGHGWYDDEAGAGYWMPVDSKPDDPANWVSNSDVVSSLRAMEAKSVLVVADSCFSGTLTRGINVQNQVGPDHLVRMSAKRSRTAISSGGFEPVQDGGKDGHSVFAGAVIKALRSNSDAVDTTTLFSVIREQVMLDAHQTPEIGNIRMAGHEGGEYVFVRER